LVVVVEGWGMNEEKVIDVLAHVERSRASDAVSGLGHYQGDWVQVTGCGTTACFAGWSVVLDGWMPVMHVGESQDEDVLLSAEWCEREGLERSIPDLAEELLGLESYQAVQLFYDCYSLEELYLGVAAMMGVSTEVLVDKVRAQAAGLEPLVWKALEVRG
jgi:hypothetical protein